MKKLVSLLMIFAVLLASSVLIYPDSPLANFALKANAEASSGTCGENLTWTFNESTGELIISGTGEMREEPNWPNGLKFVKISDGVTSIGKHAFYNSGIESVTISDSVTSIEYGAFYKCKNLTSVTIPSSVTNIGLKAFSLCQNLTRITVDSSNTAYSSDEDGVLFNKAKSELIHYPAKNIKTSYIIPNGVTIIGGGAFIECQNLINVTIPDSVTSIGDNAFIQCFNLKSVIIPDSVTSTGIGAFYACPAMEYIHISSSVTTIDNIIFSDADKAKGIESIKTDLENATEEELEEYAKQGVTKETVANWKPTTLICSDSEDCAAKTFAAENGNQFAVCDGHDDTETPEEPSTQPETPTDIPEEPSTTPEEPTTKPTEPVTKPEETEPSTTKPTEPVTKPEETEPSTTKPEEPATKPEETEPSTTKPTEPVTKPEETETSTTKPTEPVTKPEETEPSTTKPTEPATKPEETEPSTTKPTEPATKPEEPATKPSVPNEPEADEEVIPQPKVSEISYGDKIVLSVDPAKIPQGGRVEWNADNNHFDYTVGDDFSCAIDPVSSGETTFTATVYDAEGNAVSTDEQTLTAKAGFFQKIIGFFKKLFNLSKVYTNI